MDDPDAEDFSSYAISRRDVVTGMAATATILTTALTTGPGIAAALAMATWDLRDLYADARAWEASVTIAEGQIARVAILANGFSDDVERFSKALHAISRLRRDVGRLSTYARLAASANLRDADAQQRRKHADALAASLGASVAWLDPAIRTLGRNRINTWLAADPELTRFRRPLDDILRLAPHALRADEVAILATGDGLFGGPQTIYNQLLASDMPHPTINLSTGEPILLDDAGYTRARAVADRADRKRAFDGFWASYGGYGNTIGATLATQVAGDALLARLRRYDTTLDAVLDATATPRAAFSTMIAETRAGIPLLQRYLGLRQRALGLPDLHYYDIYAPLGRTNRTFPVVDARRLMLKSVAPLGAAYAGRLASASEGRWVDPSPRPGKYAGAFTNSDAYDVHPYILLNYNADYQSLSTYVHEWGHAMHAVLANAAQPFETSSYETFVAEIASTCNEQLLAGHLIATATDRQEKLFYLGQLLELLRLNIFREAMLSEFEHAIHEQAVTGVAVSGAAMSDTYYKLLVDYHSPVMTIDPAYAVEWSFIPQFYTAYYSFQYATSIAASSYFSQAIEKGDAGVRARYLAMLSAGSSDHAYDLVRNAGVDLASPAPYRALLRRFSELLDQLESLVA